MALAGMAASGQRLGLHCSNVDQRPAVRVGPCRIRDAMPAHIWPQALAGDQSSSQQLDLGTSVGRYPVATPLTDCALGDTKQRSQTSLIGSDDLRCNI